MPNEHDGAHRKLNALYRGTVTDNADPERLGRVRVRIPGVIDPASDWALPMGGGGKKARGVYAPPDVGADVVVFFHMGDEDHPHFFGGHYGAPGGTPETPGPVGGYHGSSEPPETIAPADAPLVKAWEGSRYIIVADERPGKERFFIRDKVNEDEIEFDGVKHGLTIKATTAIRIVADGAVDISGASVTIQGRVVLPSSKQIK